MNAPAHALSALVAQALGALAGAPCEPPLSPSADAVAALSRWADLVKLWNRKVDLTAARSDAELVDLLVADAAVLARFASPGARWVDVGTGCGAPGLGVALLAPSLSITLVEPLEKRVAFLRTAIGTLRRADVTVTRGKGEDVAGPFDVAVSRATLAPPAWAALGARLAPQGDVYVLLARDEPPSLEGRAITLDVAYTWPLTKAPRRLVRLSPA